MTASGSSNADLIGGVGFLHRMSWQTSEHMLALPTITIHYFHVQYTQECPLILRNDLVTVIVIHSGLERCERAAGESKLAVRQRGSVDGKLMGVISGLPGIGQKLHFQFYRLQQAETATAVYSTAELLLITVQMSASLYVYIVNMHLLLLRTESHNHPPTSLEVGFPALKYIFSIRHKIDSWEFNYELMRPHLSFVVQRSLSTWAGYQDPTLQGTTGQYVDNESSLPRSWLSIRLEERTLALKSYVENWKLEGDVSHMIRIVQSIDTSQATHSAKVTFMSLRWAKEGRKVYD
ncbi:hypothetical protein B0H19DRAFT_1070154 [Mycena capillaripes]|nr:hypothetical protein B0H19DRAFT_1070154 [Mycena capillaripes]